ncbi:MAG: diaminopimelate epimerase [bacterium]|nr:diaminopimelate epimerase [bacterium]
MNFTKLHGTGNDYLYIDDRANQVKDPEKLAIPMCNRQYGVGADGLILILNSDTADFKMRIFNADGSEAEMCGNGIRCFAKYVYDHGITDKQEIDIETLAGIKRLNLRIKDDLVDRVVVNMGQPILEREHIPMIGKPGMIINEIFLLDDRSRFKITAVSMGNPHAVIFVEDIDNFPVEKYGPIIENHDSFPHRTNVEFVKVINEKEVIQRTWERGSGETLSCGTGASAVTVAGALTNRTSRKILIHLKGGDLTTKWNEMDDNVYLTGPAVEVFEGKWPGKIK